MLHIQFWRIPKLRMWHLMGVVAAIAGFLTVYRLRQEANDPRATAMRSTHSGDPSERRDAVNSLPEGGARADCLNAAALAAKDSDPSVRAAAADAIARLLHYLEWDHPKGAREALGPFWKARIREQLITLLKDDDRSVRFHAAEAVSSCLNESENLYLPIYLEEARDRNSLKRRPAVRELLKHAATSSDVQAFLLEMQSDPNPSLRFDVFCGIADWAVTPKAPQAAIDAIAARLTDNDYKLRQAAVETVGKLGRRAGPLIPALIGALDDPVQRIQLQAIASLEALGLESQSALPALRKLADRPSNPFVNETMKAINNIKWANVAFREAVLAQLKRELLDKDALVRLLATKEIGGHGPAASAAFPDLIRLLSDSDSRVRLATVEALGAIDPESSAEALSKVAEADPDARIRAAAKEILEILK